MAGWVYSDAKDRGHKDPGSWVRARKIYINLTTYYVAWSRMHKSILSDLERRRIKVFNKTNGEKESFMTVLATRCRQNLPRIKGDVALIEEFMSHYKPKN